MATGGSVQSVRAALLDVERFSIPDFQRNYAWEDKEIDDFLTDVRSATQLQKQHFIGALILLSKSPADDVKKSYEVIDGQQRLTTIFMYLSLLRDAAVAQGNLHIDPPVAGGMPVDVMSAIGALVFADPGRGEARFESNRILRRLFRESIVAHPAPGRPKLPVRDKASTLALRKAYSRLERSLRDDLAALPNEVERLKRIFRIFQTVTANFNLLCIYTTTYSEAFDIFMTLNNRGRALGPADLVKTLLMKYSTEGESDTDLLQITERISADWEGITNNLEEGDIDQFLRHFMLSIQSGPVRSKVIYSSVDDHLTKDSQGRLVDVATQKRNSSEFLKSLEKASLVYKSLLNPRLLSDARIRNSCQTLLQVLDSYRILMMRVLADDSPLSLVEKREVSRLAEVLSLRWTIIGGNAQELEDHFQETCALLRASAKPFNSVKRKLIEKIPSDDRVLPAFKDSVSADLARAVYYGINVHTGDPAALVPLVPRSLQIEHVAPATATDEWINYLYGPKAAESPEKQAEYAVKVESWGNKTLLEYTINNALKQKQFLVKRDGDSADDLKGYKDSVLQVTKDLAVFDEWSLTRIEKRGNWVGDSFVKIWSVDQDLGNVWDFSEWCTRNP